MYPWFHDSVSCFINQMLSSFGSRPFWWYSKPHKPWTARPHRRKSQEVKAFSSLKLFLIRTQLYHLFIRLPLLLTEIKVPVAHIERGKAKRKKWTRQDVNFLGPKCPCCHPELKLVADSRWCGGGQDGGHGQLLARSSDPPYQRILQI